MRLYKRLGLRKYEMPVNLIRRSLGTGIQGVKDIQVVPSVKGHLICDACLLACYYYCLERGEEARKAAHNVLVRADEYFFGEWRNNVPTDQGKIDPGRFKRYMIWIEHFRETIFWGSCLDEWEKVEEIAQYPGDDTEGEIWEPKEYRAWYLVIAAILRGQSLSELRKYTDIVEAGRRKREKLLLKVLRAILADDVATANRELETYLKYYKKYEFPKPEITEKVCIDGTFLINFARHRGLELEYPAEYSDHIVRFELSAAARS